MLGLLAVDCCRADPEVARAPTVTPGPHAGSFPYDLPLPWLPFASLIHVNWITRKRGRSDFSRPSAFRGRGGSGECWYDQRDVEPSSLPARAAMNERRASRGTAAQRRGRPDQVDANVVSVGDSEISFSGKIPSTSQRSLQSASTESTSSPWVESGGRDAFRRAGPGTTRSAREWRSRPTIPARRRTRVGALPGRQTPNTPCRRGSAAAFSGPTG